MEFSSFDVDCDGDHVDIYNAASTRSPPPITLCGTTRPPVILSSGRNLLLKFVTDDESERSGFHLTWRPGGKIITNCVLCHDHWVKDYYNQI